MKRQVVLDTETTGLRPEEGHRIVEVGAVELIDGVKTGRTFYSLVNPQRDIPFEVVRIHQIDNAKVAHSPIFRQIAPDFLDFINGSELLIHNAEFDVKFLNNELKLADKGKVWDYISNVRCTLKLSKMLLEQEKNHKLDTLCAKFGIDLSERESKGHGALLDSHLLADVYINLRKHFPLEDIEADMEQTNWTRPPVKRFPAAKLSLIELSPAETLKHQQYLDDLAKEKKVTPVFSRQATKLSM